MLYEDPIEIIEALGYEAALGAREWFDGRHVGDLRALAEALYWSQTARVEWDEQAIHGDPFGEELAALARELLIEPPRIATSRRRVTPSFYTWRPPLEYIADKVYAFFSARHLPPGFAPLKLEQRYRARERKLAIVRARAGRELTLMQLPLFYDYTSDAMLKGDLMRSLIEAVSVVERHGLCGNGGYRALYSHAVAYVDALWGTAPRA